MLLQPIANLLKATVIDFRSVAGAANYAAAREDIKNTPCAYVIPLDDKAQPNNLLGSPQVEQQVAERFAVILAVSNARDMRGDAVNGVLEPLRTAVIKTLLGYQAATDYDPIQYVSGRLLGLDAAVMWWQLEFMTGYFERKI